MVTRLGFPSIATPNELALPALQGSINNIRERFEKLEAEVALLRKFLDNSTSLNAIALLQRQVGSLAQQVTFINSALSTEVENTEPSGDALLAEMTKNFVEEFGQGDIRAQLSELGKRIDGVEQGILV